MLSRFAQSKIRLIWEIWSEKKNAEHFDWIVLSGEKERQIFAQINQSGLICEKQGCGLGLDVSVSRPSRDVLTSRLGLGPKGLGVSSRVSDLFVSSRRFMQARHAKLQFSNSNQYALVRSSWLRYTQQQRRPWLTTLSTFRTSKPHAIASNKPRDAAQLQSIRISNQS